MSVKQMDVAKLKQLLEQNKVVLVDVREPDEYAQGHIAGSTLVPLALVHKAALPEIKQGQTLVLQCRSGMRSQHACEQLVAEDASLDAYNLDGGILAWIEQGYPVSH